MHETVTFGGRERPVAFTASAMAKLQRRYRFQNAATWMLNDVLGCDLVAGTNTSFNIEARFATLGAAIECGARKAYPLGKIEEWYDEAVKDGSLHQALWSVVACAFESGAVTARVVEDFDKSSGALRAVFFAATPAELEAAIKAYWDKEDAGGDETPASPTSSSVAADAS